jgi:hypothetical protein
MSLEQIRALLGGRRRIQICSKQAEVEHEYRRLPREAKGLLRKYLGKITGLSRAQGTRPIGQYRACTPVHASRRGA